MPRSSSNQFLEAAGREMKRNPPAILEKTRRRRGAEAAEKQRLAIMFSKASQARRRQPQASITKEEQLEAAIAQANRRQPYSGTISKEEQREAAMAQARRRQR